MTWKRPSVRGAKTIWKYAMASYKPYFVLSQNWYFVHTAHQSSKSVKELTNHDVLHKPELEPTAATHNNLITKATIVKRNVWIFSNYVTCVPSRNMVFRRQTKDLIDVEAPLDQKNT